MSGSWRFACALALPFGLPAQADSGQLEDLVREYLWPRTAAELERAQARIDRDADLVGVSRMRMHDLAELMRRGRPEYPPAPAAGDDLLELQVELPGGTAIPVLVRLPSRYSPDTPWPLMFAMHGGPPSRPEGVSRSALRMVQVWAEPAERAGWIVAAPGMLTTVSAGGRTQDRLPYEIFHEDDARAVVDALRELLNINPNRIVSTGISLGSNFSIGYAAAHPDWLSAIVPVSTEGDSRELILRNLKSTPVYVLEGSQDRNIRGVGGPRALHQILTGFGYDLTYREFGDRAHEGFQEHYDDVLRWLDSRPRQLYPRNVLRVPHTAIMPVARRVHWIEADTRQALVEAAVVDAHSIDITTRFARQLTVYLHDRLVDLDLPVTIRINGEPVFAGTVPRSIPTALRQARTLGDERRVYAAAITLQVPTTSEALERGVQLSRKLAAGRGPGQLSFWEMYAQRAIEERFPDVGFDGIEEALPEPLTSADDAGERVGLRVREVVQDTPFALAGLRPGDLLLQVDGEPFFAGNGGVDTLYSWLVRELRGAERSYELSVWRDAETLALPATLKLGPYADR